MIAQTIQFDGISPEKLYGAYLSSTEHSGMTAEGRAATYYRPTEGEVAHGREGDELRAFGFVDSDGKAQFALRATILKLVPNKVIVLAWKNRAWEFALDSNDVTDLDSTVIFTFKKNFMGAEIQLVQVNVPEYKVKLPDTQEVGSLRSIVNTHWNLLYWEPMRKYFQNS